MLDLQQHACIRALNECAIACIEFADLCGRHASLDLTYCAALNFDCVELCRFTASAIVRESALLESICLLCAESCDISRTECEKHDSDHCRRCAVASKKCAEACREVARQIGITKQIGIARQIGIADKLILQTN